MQEEECHDAYLPSELAERRARLAIGLKRYFHSKRLEGLLSTAVRPFILPGRTCAIRFAHRKLPVLARVSLLIHAMTDA